MSAASATSPPSTAPSAATTTPRPPTSGSFPKQVEPWPKASGVAGFHGQHGGLDAEPAQGHLVAEFGRGVEDQLRVGRAVEPAIGLELDFELSRAPARIAERQNRVFRAVAPGDGPEDVPGGREAHAVVDG